MTRKKVHVAAAFGIISIMLIWLTVSGFNDDSMQYYINVKEVKAMGDAAYSQGLRVKGYLVPGSLKTSPNSLAVSFLIEDEGQEMMVRYAKELPDTFKDGAEVLVSGKYTHDEYFDAQMLMAKCPSKYETGDEYNLKDYDPAKHLETDGTY